MQGIIFIFQICAMAITLIVFPEIVKVDNGILNMETLLTSSLFCVQQKQNYECIVFQFMFLHR